jgi:hypothetical protein
MSGVFRNINRPPSPHHPASVYPPPPPAFGAGGGHTRWVERGWGVNSSEDARHCTVFYTVIVSTLCYKDIKLRCFEKSSLLQAGRLHAAAEVQQRGGSGAAESTHGSPQSHRNTCTPTPHNTPTPLPASISWCRHRAILIILAAFFKTTSFCTGLFLSLCYKP